MFRALKTKGKTPKYGLIFNSTFIGRAGLKNKGKISRYLANKCAIASRVDCFSEAPTNKFGEGLKAQVEERLKFLSSGVKPRKNKDAMAEVIAELKGEGLFYGDKVKVAKTVDSGDEDEVQIVESTPNLPALVSLQPLVPMSVTKDQLTAFSSALAKLNYEDCGYLLWLDYSKVGEEWFNCSFSF